MEITQESVAIEGTKFTTELVTLINHYAEKLPHLIIAKHMQLQVMDLQHIAAGKDAERTAAAGLQAFANALRGATTEAPAAAPAASPTKTVRKSPKQLRAAPTSRRARTA